MQPLCHEDNIAQTPYSALASGKLAKRPGETSKRQKEDAFMHFKYDATAEQDNRVVERVVELADRYGVEMTQISLAWLLTKVESPIVGATKLHPPFYPYSSPRVAPMHLLSLSAICPLLHRTCTGHIPDKYRA